MILLLLFLILLVVASILPSPEIAAFEEYAYISEETGIPYEEMITLDYYRYNMSFANVDPLETAEDFLIMNMHVTVHKYKKKNNGWRKTSKNEYDYDYDSYKSFCSRVNVSRMPGLINRVIQVNELDGNTDITYSWSKTKKTKIEISSSISYKSLETMMEEVNLREDYRDLARISLEQHLIDTTYCPLPDSVDISDYVNSYYAFPTPELKVINITSPFGYRIHPVTGVRSFHNGIDISGNGDALGSPVVSIYDGEVIYAARTNLGGNTVKIKHTIDGKSMTSIYLHLQSYGVSVGDTVERGEVIGAIGSTGRSTGPHLHLSIMINNAYVDPLEILDRNIDE